LYGPRFSDPQNLETYFLAKTVVSNPSRIVTAPKNPQGARMIVPPDILNVMPGADKRSGLFLAMFPHKFEAKHNNAADIRIQFHIFRNLY
jgi:hypothetical protein